MHFYNDYTLVRHLCLIYSKFLAFLTFNKLRLVYYNSDIFFKWKPGIRLINNKVFYYNVRALIILNKCFRFLQISAAFIYSTNY